jgi:cell division protein FtsL
MSSPTDDGWDDWDDASNTSSQESQQSSGGWDDWGDSNTSQQNEGWGSNSDDGWGNLRNQQQESESEWDDWGDSNPQQNGGFIENEPQQPTYSDQSFNQQSSGNFPQEEFDNPIPEGNAFPKVGTKTAAVIVAGACIFLALILYVMTHIHISSNTGTTNVQEQVQQEESQIDNQQTEQTQEEQSAIDESGKAVLVEIPNSTGLTYSDDVYTANGKVTNKTKYIVGSQVTYCIVVSITLSNSTVTVNHFCTLDTYNSVNSGDVVVVNYQTVNDTYVSISSISK